MCVALPFYRGQMVFQKEGLKEHLQGEWDNYLPAAIIYLKKVKFCERRLIAISAVNLLGVGAARTCLDGTARITVIFSF